MNAGGMPIRLARMSVYPYLAMGIDFGMEEKTKGVALGTPLIALGEVAWDENRGRAYFQSLHGLYTSRLEMIEGNQKSEWGYWLGLAAASALAGYCIYKCYETIKNATQRREPR